MSSSSAASSRAIYLVDRAGTAFPADATIVMRFTMTRQIYHKDLGLPTELLDMVLSEMWEANNEVTIDSTCVNTLLEDPPH